MSRKLLVFYLLAYFFTGPVVFAQELQTIRIEDNLEAELNSLTEEKRIQVNEVIEGCISKDIESEMKMNIKTCITNGLITVGGGTVGLFIGITSLAATFKAAGYSGAFIDSLLLKVPILRRMDFVHYDWRKINNAFIERISWAKKNGFTNPKEIIQLGRLERIQEQLNQKGVPKSTTKGIVEDFIHGSGNKSNVIKTLEVMEKGEPVFKTAEDLSPKVQKLLKQLDKELDSAAKINVFEKFKKNVAEDVIEAAIKRARTPQLRLPALKTSPSIISRARSLLGKEIIGGSAGGVVSRVGGVGVFGLDVILNYLKFTKEQEALHGDLIPDISFINSLSCNEITWALEKVRRESTQNAYNIKLTAALNQLKEVKDAGGNTQQELLVGNYYLDNMTKQQVQDYCDSIKTQIKKDLQRLISTFNETGRITR